LFGINGGIFRISTSAKIKLLKNRIKKLTHQIQKMEIEIEQCKKQLEKFGVFNYRNWGT